MKLTKIFHNGCKVIVQSIGPQTRTEVYDATNKLLKVRVKYIKRLSVSHNNVQPLGLVNYNLKQCHKDDIVTISKNVFNPKENSSEAVIVDKFYRDGHKLLESVRSKLENGLDTNPSPMKAMDDLKNRNGYSKTLRLFNDNGSMVRELNYLYDDYGKRISRTSVSSAEIEKLYRLKEVKKYLQASFNDLTKERASMINALKENMPVANKGVNLKERNEVLEKLKTELSYAFIDPELSYDRNIDKMYYSFGEDATLDYIQDIEKKICDIYRNGQGLKKIDDFFREDTTISDILEDIDNCIKENNSKIKKLFQLDQAIMKKGNQLNEIKQNIKSLESHMAENEIQFKGTWLSANINGYDFTI